MGNRFNAVHIHGILILDDDSGSVGTGLVPVRGIKINECRHPQGESLQNQLTVGAFKSIITNPYINGVKNGLVEPFRKYLRHSRFYDHIIQNEMNL